MNEFNIKKTMEQIHISEEMQEEIIMNIQDQMKNGKNKARNWKKMAAVAAALVLTAGVVSIPVQAVVKNIVQARMESIPKEEVQAIVDFMQEQKVNADGFSREYSDKEKERMKELEQLYQDGTFPENTILQVENGDGVMEGTLCYIEETGDFYLPDRELTDEELLEIIDFYHIMSYAIEQSPAAQEARAEMEAERARIMEQIQAEEGISEEEAIEIAMNQMKSDLGERAEGKEILKYQDGSVAVLLQDISDETNYEHKGSFAYYISYRNSSDHSYYTCTIDAADGNILLIDTNEPMSEE